jgi:hypothetical protein
MLFLLCPAFLAVRNVSEARFVSFIRSQETIRSDAPVGTVGHKPRTRLALLRDYWNRTPQCALSPGEGNRASL